MSLSSKARKALEIALANSSHAPASVSKEIADAIDGTPSPASHISSLGTTTNLSTLTVTPSVVPSSNATLSTSNTYTDAAVKTAIDGAVNTAATSIDGFLNLKADNTRVDNLRVEAEARLDAIEAKIDAILAALQAAHLMS